LKNKSMLKILFLSLVLSSCGLVDKFKTPDQTTDSSEATASNEENVPTESTTAENQAAGEANVDDLFGNAMNETTNNAAAATDGAIKSLQDEFSAAGPAETKISEKIEKVKDIPVIVQDTLSDIKRDNTPSQDAGAIKNYTVKKGETLMQIAFSIYGDVSKWKEIKNLNNGNTNHLKPGSTIKYRVPAKAFVWNPTGTPHLIKTGETLGTISNSVYATPKKWKSIWENNKPLIKNPNVIYAGFTLYYQNGNGMANYVQPKAAQPEINEARENAAPELKREVASLTNNENNGKAEEIQIDEAIQSLSAPERIQEAKPKAASKEIDLINNVTSPLDQEELSPDIDEEVQTL